MLHSSNLKDSLLGHVLNFCKQEILKDDNVFVVSVSLKQSPILIMNASSEFHYGVETAYYKWTSIQEGREVFEQIFSWINASRKKIFFCSFQIKSGINTCPSTIKSITSKQVKIGRKTKTKKVLWRTQAHHSRKFIFKAFRLKCQVNKAKNFTDFRRGYQQYPKNAKASLLATTTVRARETTSTLWGHFLRIWSVLLNIWHTRQSLYVLEHLSVKRMDVHISRTFMDKYWQWKIWFGNNLEICSNNNITML